MTPWNRRLAIASAALFALWLAWRMWDVRTGEPERSVAAAESKRAFDAEAWRANDPAKSTLRSEMIDDLVHGGLVLGSERASVHELLGPPSRSRGPTPGSTKHVVVDTWRLAPEIGLPTSVRVELDLTFRDGKLAVSFAHGELRRD